MTLDQFGLSRWAREVLADARFEQQRAAARALRAQIEKNAALGQDKVVQSDLLRFAQDSAASQGDELSATLNAVKSRHAPVYSGPSRYF